jgi:hypothetical protein
MNWLILDLIKGNDLDGLNDMLVRLCREVIRHENPCLIGAHPLSPWPEQCARENFSYAPLTRGSSLSPVALLHLRQLGRHFQPDVVMVRELGAARLARLAWPAAAIGLLTASARDLKESLVNRWTCNTCIDRIFTDLPFSPSCLHPHPWMLPGKRISMTDSIRSTMEKAREARQDLHTPATTTPAGPIWLRSSATTLGPEALSWDQQAGAEPVTRSGHATVHRLQSGGATVYLKRFLGSRLSLRGLGWRDPVALENFRMAARLTLRGAAVVPHLAAGWHFGSHRADESLLITGTIPGAVTLDRWPQSQGSPPGIQRDLVRELAAWLAHLHRAGIACHDLKASNILVHQPPDGRLEFTLLDLDNCRLRLTQSTDHDAQRNFHQLFRSFQTRATPPCILRFLAVYRRVRGLDRRHLGRLTAEVERRLHRRGTGYAEIVTAYRAGHVP